MCGIFGVIGQKNNAPQIVFKGLLDIEYRGYDSWGIASWKMDDRRWKVEKKVGFLPKTLSLPSSKLALGHTRWATHGGVTDVNAHPHADCNKKLVLVHNGIVENYLELKKSLGKHKFNSETDTEVVVHAIEEKYEEKSNLKDAVSYVFNKLEGLNALVVSDGLEIVVCKTGSPLVVGKSKNGYIVASDPNALLPFTHELLFLEDGELVLMNEELNLYRVKNMKKLQPKFTKVSWEHSKASLKQYPHFMLKEIFEQPQVLYNQIQNLSMVEEISKEINQAYGTYFVGCGTASYACISGAYLFSGVSKKHVNFSIGSEFNYIQDFLKPESLLIAVSQSGETIDIVEPVSAAKKIGAKIVAITNTLGSTLYRIADIKLLLQAGPEKAVASTKAYIAMLANMILLSFCVASKLEDGVKVIEESAKEVERVLSKQDEIKKLAEMIKNSEHMYILGRGLSYPLALESALKIKETSYIHAEGFASGELKHGTLALIDKKTPVVVYIPNDETKGAVLANAMEVKVRGAYVIGVGVEEEPMFDYFFKVKDCGASSVLPHIVFAQLLGYFLAVKLGRNPDKPRNLAKSVTVK